VNTERHWEAGIQRVWRCTCRPPSGELRYVRCDSPSLQVILEVLIQRVVVRVGGTTRAGSLLISSLVIVGDERIE
jgi:hypothetical protein